MFAPGWLVKTIPAVKVVDSFDLIACKMYRHRQPSPGAIMLFRTFRILIAGCLIFSVGSACKSGTFSLGKGDPSEQVAEVKRSPKIVKRPPWILGKEHPSYPRALYVTGLGSSMEDAVAARRSARSELAKSLKVKIRSRMRDISTEEWTRVELVVESEVDAVLEGVEIEDGWVDPRKNVHYSFAVMKRSMASAGIKERIENMAAQLAGYMQKGQQAEAKGDLVGAYSNYFYGYSESPRFVPLKNMFRVISGKEIKIGPEEKPSGQKEFEAQIKGITRNLKIAPASGDRQVVKSHKNLSDPLVAKIFLVKGNREIPFINVPIRFKYVKGDGSLDGRGVSDENGTVKTEIYKIHSFEEESHTVSAEFDLETFALNFKSDFSGHLNPLRNIKTDFHYTIQKITWASTKSQALNKGISNLVNQIIGNLPPDKNLTVGIIDFIELGTGKSTRFSRVIKEDVQTVLARAENLSVREIIVREEDKLTPREIATGHALDLYVMGSYRMEKGGLEVRGRMIETATKNIQATGDILIKKDEINPKDRELLMESQGHPLSPNTPEGYDQSIENLFSAKPEQASFELSVWTKERDYEIGEQISFFVKADADCYLTLLDIMPDGHVTVIFPNKYHEDNFIRANVTYQIPEENYGFTFRVQEPPGLDRIKAFATLSPDSPLKLDLSKGFHTIRPGTMRGTRGIQVLSKKFTPNSPSKWSEAHAEIFIHKKGKVFIRGKKKLHYTE